MFKKNLAVGLFAVLLVAGCGDEPPPNADSGPQVAGGDSVQHPPPASHPEPRGFDPENLDCEPNPRPPMEIVVVAYEEDGALKVVPDRIVVQHPNQKVIWRAIKGTLGDIVFHPNDCSRNPPPPVRGPGEELWTNFPPGHRGEYKYDLTFTPGEGPNAKTPMTVDPSADIDF